MSASSTWRLFRRTVLVALLAGTSSCAAPPMRLPLAVPLAAVGGSRSATPQGLWALAEFGDGVWGQEQERVEVYGVGVGFAMRDRFEFNVSGYQPTVMQTITQSPWESGPTPVRWTGERLCVFSLFKGRWSQRLPQRQRRWGVEASRAPRRLS